MCNLSRGVKKTDVKRISIKDSEPIPRYMAMGQNPAPLMIIRKMNRIRVLGCPITQVW